MVCKRVLLSFERIKPCHSLYIKDNILSLQMCGKNTIKNNILRYGEKIFFIRWIGKL